MGRFTVGQNKLFCNLCLESFVSEKHVLLALDCFIDFGQMRGPPYSIENWGSSRGDEDRCSVLTRQGTADFGLFCAKWYQLRSDPGPMNCGLVFDRRATILKCPLKFQAR
jgi:hypothetical protein